MGNMRDQLKKAKLLSKKDARRLAHEERVHRKETGREGLEKEQAERQAELTQQRAESRAQDQVQQAELEAQRQEAAERAACAEILRGAQSPTPGGGSRWYFELADGRIPSLMLGARERVLLEAGNACLVRGEGSGHAYGLLETGLARRVAAVFPERIAWAAAGIRNALGG